MSDMLRGYQRRIENWEDFARWVSDALVTLTVGDTFEIGQVDNVRSEEAQEVTPCVQAVALEDSALLFRRSRVVMGVPLLQNYSLEGIDLDAWRGDPLFEDCTDGFIISRDARMLANVSVSWFRDCHALELEELGCEHYRAVSLASPSPPPEGASDLPDWHAMSASEQDTYVAEALRRAGLESGSTDETP